MTDVEGLEDPSCFEKLAGGGKEDEAEVCTYFPMCMCY